MKKSLYTTIALILFNFSLTAQNFIISGGESYSTMICDSGKVYMWGNKNPTPTQLLFPGNVKIKAVDAGTGDQFLGIDEDSNAWVWGLGADSMWSNITTTKFNTPVRVVAGTTNPTDSLAPLGKVKYISSGNKGVFLVLDNGKLVSYGSNNSRNIGYLGYGNSKSSRTPKYVLMPNGNPLTNVIQVDAGDFTVYALADPDGDGAYSVYSWGDGTNGKLGRNLTGTQNSGMEYINDAFARPVIMKNGTHLKNIVSISAGDGACYALDKNGYIWAWGEGWGGLTGTSYFLHSDPKRVVAGEWSGIKGAGFGAEYLRAKSISGGRGFAMAVTTDGRPMAWGNNDGCINSYSSGGQLGNGKSYPSQSPYPVFIRKSENLIDSNVVSISDGDLWGYYISSNGEFSTWGSNTLGQLGLGNISTGCASLYAVPFTPPCAIPAFATNISLSPKDTSICLENTNNFTLKTNFKNPRATQFTIEWYRNNTKVFSGNGLSAANYTTNLPGKFVVKLIPESSLAKYNFATQTDSTTVLAYTQQFSVPVNRTYCGATSKISVIGKGIYNWFYKSSDALPFTTSVKNDSISFEPRLGEILADSSVIIYAQEKSNTVATFIPNDTITCKTRSNNYASNLKTKITVYKTITLDSVTVYYNGIAATDTNKFFNWQFCTYQIQAGSPPKAVTCGTVKKTLTHYGINDTRLITIPINIKLEGSAVGFSYYLGFNENVKAIIKEFNCSPINNNNSAFNISGINRSGYDIDTNTFKNSGNITKFHFSTVQEYCNKIPVTIKKQKGCNLITDLEEMESFKTAFVSYDENSKSIGIYLEGKNSSVSITDMNGRKIWQSKSNTTNNFSINASDFSNGLYLVTIISTNGTSTQKIVKY
jgi:alpha-tubulin suppressor-like RCC1 family protein